MFNKILKMHSLLLLLIIMIFMIYIENMFYVKMYFNLLLLMKKFIIRNAWLLIEELLNFYNYSAKTIIFKVKILLENNPEKSDKLTL